MIFCTVGTTDFDPLVQAVDTMASEWDEAVVFQIGQGRYEPANGDWFRFRPDITDLIGQATLVIAHGGFGTTIEVLTIGTPLVSVPNPDRYDRHQEEILRRFAAEGYLTPCFDLAELPAAVEAARTTPMRAYKPPATSLHTEIREFLEQIGRS